MSRLTGRLQTATTMGTTQRVSGVGVPLSVAGVALSVGVPLSVAAPPPDAPLSVAGVPLSVGVPPSRRSRMERRLLVVGSALLGGVLAAVVLAGSLSDAMTSRGAALDALQANQAIQQRVEAGRREADFAQTPAFLSFAARSFGWGSGGERAFALKPGGPPPPVIEPLGTKRTPTTPADPLDSVLELLFDR